MAASDAPTARRPDRGRWSFSLGHIAGVELRVHVTFLLLVALIAASAGDTGQSPVAGVVWVLALFTCVVVHELSHALVARSKGIEVHEIDLLPIGGVSRMERIPEDWRDEGGIAVAGPLASAALAVLLFLVAEGLGQALLPPRLWAGPFVVRLAWANVMLAGFNLVPAFPLDGGRVLRALLERRQSRLAATHRAARISRWLAFGMIAVGVISNIWLVIIGMFVIVAGRAEEAAVLLHTALVGETADTVALPCPTTFPAGLPVEEASRLARETAQAAFPVIDGAGRLLGLITRAGLRSASPYAVVGELATGRSVEATTPLEDVAAVPMPVVVTKSGRAIGVITAEALSAELEVRLRDTQV